MVKWVPHAYSSVSQPNDRTAASAITGQREGQRATDYGTKVEETVAEAHGRLSTFLIYENIPHLLGFCQFFFTITNFGFIFYLAVLFMSPATRNYSLFEIKL